MTRLALLLCVLALPTLAQTTAIVQAPGGVVRWLDKVSGELADIDLARGQSVVKGRLTIQLDECRYPYDDPASNAYAHLTVVDSLNHNTPVFSGWMIASSPALSAMDHPRYDVWILRCDTDMVVGE
ncbi:MAG: DUF2155 domain-containing protein [Rhodobacter sp.]|nr:DUF2155 domain-containing protein [Rhodobacter sp.]